LVAWDVFEAVLTPGLMVLLCTWSDHLASEAFETASSPPDGVRCRRVRVICDCGLFDRREVPQYFPDVNALAWAFS
jgi:hypothetical protein